ncbi:MAG: hypothetical protein HYV09_37955 [Deltaproteobacteria bacterium]|nr:hypothetical protein [Deltaproteobacteria bacterium]
MRIASRVLIGIVLCASPASSSETAPAPHPMPDVEAQAKGLSTAKDVPVAYDALMSWLGLSACPSGECDKVLSVKWTDANLDADEADERVLAITTSGAGACPSARVAVVVLDKTAKGWIAAASTSLRIAGATAPVAEVVAAQVHSAKVKDLVVRLDGRCDGGEREHELRVVTFEQGRLDEIATSVDFVGKGLVAHAVSGAAPATIQLTDAKGKTQLWFDPSAYAYDALPPYEDAKKATVSKDDDDTLSTKECAAPLSAAVALECGLEGSAKVQVLVKQGKAIGATVAVTPANPSFVRCMRKHVASASWPSLPGATGCVRTFAAK